MILFFSFKNNPWNVDKIMSIFRLERIFMISRRLIEPFEEGSACFLGMISTE